MLFVGVMSCCCNVIYIHYEGKGWWNMAGWCSPNLTKTANC